MRGLGGGGEGERGEREMKAGRVKGNQRKRERERERERERRESARETRSWDGVREIGFSVRAVADVTWFPPPHTKCVS